ncbi:mediator of RNA polymerase II transcription subunit 19 [Sodiomyces alkalinus F11]|uniref:Mediator of RNA polymerase II transcription subunit 19 n=1 Tax=Sodiomyces alkalinus (strain CBS 110278 / VKM F-3762 / F11) TaxID=1314773 RepID=A0A3N2PXI3_SODAK|nr:mediator of RNA polymerase II transcription subunit 19 [Sodiomyces alkalinus F11]ROT39239.1 mediator of RNA polymerase II transcription subunit 19 [Sodiomyces alkalinus F11]
MSFHPQTPQSPSQLSPGTSDLASSMNSTLTSITTNLPTPAHSVNGSTTHPSDMSQDFAMGEDTPHKRKRSIDDVGDREHKKAHIEDSRIGIEDIHLDVGEKYLLCQTQHRRQRFPQITEDLFEMFDLTGIAAEVAREKPDGEKNALRKTYKGHMKRLGVMGRFDSVKQPWEDPKQDVDESSEQDDAFDSNGQKKEKSKKEEYFGFGKIATIHDAEFWHGRSHLTAGLTPSVKASLNRAVAMAKGPIPAKQWDTTVLGDIAAPADPTKNAFGKATAPGTPIGTPGLTAAKPQQQPQGVPRPQRNTKKRGYGDSSFEGYGEGFPDDGYLTGDGDDRGGQKRQKKSAGTPQFPQNGTPRQAYGSGIGV